MFFLYFSKTNIAIDLKLGKYIELNDIMKLHQYQWSRPFFDLRKDHPVFKFKSRSSQNLLSYLKRNIM